MRTLLVLPLVFGSILAAPPPATADTPGCVVRSEFRQVHHGMTTTSVQRIFDTSGTLNSAARHEVRTYRACNRPRLSYVSVHFSGGKVIAKFAIWA
jgi:hypothetical protein